MTPDEQRLQDEGYAREVLDKLGRLNEKARGYAARLPLHGKEAAAYVALIYDVAAGAFSLQRYMVLAGFECALEPFGERMFSARFTERAPGTRSGWADGEDAEGALYEAAKQALKGDVP